MSLSARSIAVEGIGFGARHVALRGIALADELSVFSGGNARIGSTPLIDTPERAGMELLDADARVGEELMSGRPERAGGAILDDDARAGEEVLADADERVGSETLTQRSRIGRSRLKPLN